MKEKLTGTVTLSQPFINWHDFSPNTSIFATVVGESKTYQSTIQTAMQELIDELIKESKSIDDNTALVYASICAKINFKYLEKEKQQIIEDFYAGRDDWERKYPDATNYYNQTYNQNK